MQRYAPELEKRTLWYQNRISFSWRVDETCIRVKGPAEVPWKYLYRAIDKGGNTLDFLLSDRRNAKAAKRFLAKTLRRSRDWKPRVINTDKNPAFCNGCSLVNPFLSFDPVAGVLLLSGVGAGPPPDGVG